MIEIGYSSIPEIQRGSISRVGQTVVTIVLSVIINSWIQNIQNRKPKKDYE